MTLSFTNHAIRKLKSKEARRFRINKNKLKKAIERPLSKQFFELGVIRITSKLDENHSLVVIYKHEDDIIKIITFYPAEKGRYEN